MHSSAHESPYKASDEEYEAFVQEMARLVVRLTPRQCDELIESSDLSIFANAVYKQVHAILRRPNKAEKPTRRDVILTRELYHALKQRAASLLSNTIFNSTKRMMLDHLSYAGAYAFATQQDITHQRLVRRAAQVDEHLVSGLCFALAASGVMAVMLNDINSFDVRVSRLEGTSDWRLSKIKDFLANKRDFAKLNEKEAEDAIFFQVILLFQKLHTYKQIHHEEQRVGHQDFFAAAKLVAPEPLQEMALCSNFTWIYDRRSLAQLFDQLEDKFFSDAQKSPVAIMITSLRHIICVTFDYEHNAWRLINAAPSFLVRKEFIADRILKTFSMQDLNNIVLNFQFVTLASTANQYYEAMLELMEWNVGHIQKTLEIAKLPDSQGATVLQVAARCGDLICVNGSIHAGFDVNAAEHLSALECAVMRHYSDIVDVLIIAGANINYQRDESSLSILARAILLGSHAIIKRLLQEGDKLDKTIIHKFSEDKFDFICEAYEVTAEKRQAFLNKHRNKSDVIFTAFDLLALVDYPEVEKLLTAENANIESRNVI